MTEISEKENEPQNLHRPQATVPSQPESKLQRLKRSLSFKSVMRSKSMDNFFQRSNGDSRLPTALITVPPLPPSPPPFSESPLAYERSPPHSPSNSPNASLSSHSPSVSPSLSVTSKGLPKSQGQPVKTHCFQEHVFRRPTSCQRCKHMIQGNSKQGLRCKACKLAAHLWCSSELSQQPCNGKSGAFKRNFSSPLLTTDQLGVVREAPAAQEADNSVVDPVYEALRYGTSLAQMSRSSFSSISESPCHEENNEDKLENQPIAEEEQIPGMLTPPESEKADSEDRVSLKTPKRVEVHSIHTYVALYKFLPQEKNDLELQPGDRIQVTDDSNEDWWKGKSRDKVGLFPANFVQRVRPGERVWKVTDGFHGNRDKGQMTVKEAQICVGKNEETDGFLRLSSGKKRGLVPLKCLLEI
ncbi:SH3 and cysteine-rich domain-containing protein 2-like [Notolabrus celidotus]|uniref:SH3 and cysteine-rich domain-containing protein 2-like n=1 Tax=Notolabrus celidotus TaxID=1203425 RepID=UPI00148FE60F|nr:SH3 and cysteine-rich domain-containing protein 2-like [Notolabrus celidotus]XP_034563179.1 SH3 and cysteine-rich domain-containing protein 2-like [Notolabrus celidotus]XP_034563180.1 SH3 and cysteine-rich domain-containing protein 2-like [Notolabrus celidotus]